MYGLYYMIGLFVGYALSFDFHVLYHWMSADNGWGIAYGFILLFSSILTFNIIIGSVDKG